MEQLCGSAGILLCVAEIHLMWVLYIMNKTSSEMALWYRGKNIFLTKNELWDFRLNYSLENETKLFFS